MDYTYKFSTDYINFYFKKRDKSQVNLQNYDYEIMVAPTKNYIVSPPISSKELKELADFIYGLLDNKQKEDYHFVDTLPMEPAGIFYR